MSINILRKVPPASSSASLVIPLPCEHICLAASTKVETQVAVARLCYLPPAYRVPRRMLRGYDPDECHVRLRGGKALLCPPSRRLSLPLSRLRCPASPGATSTIRHKARPGEHPSRWRPRGSFTLSVQTMTVFDGNLRGTICRTGCFHGYPFEPPHVGRSPVIEDEGQLFPWRRRNDFSCWRAVVWVFTASCRERVKSRMASSSSEGTITSVKFACALETLRASSRPF